MTRAIERLKQLESRNTLLEAEVAKLKQRVAILDHVAATSGAGDVHVRATKKGQSTVKVEEVEDDDGEQVVGEV
jgi:hypothetical protein